MGKKEKNLPPPYLATKDINELDIVRCPKCKGAHFRHTGDVMTYRTYLRDDKRSVGNVSNGDVDLNSYLVYVCIRCGIPWIRINDQLFDASEEIDVVKYDKVNKVLQEETKTDPHC